MNVLNPGEIAATAGTSGVVYGVLGDVNYDPKSRVNTFAHVNHQADQTRLGVLLCINGTGILNAWVHRNITPGIGYAEMNDLAAQAPIGSDGVTIVPFGNGAERVLENREIGCSVNGLNFNKHSQAHLVRALLILLWHGNHAADGYGYQEDSCRQGQYVLKPAIP